MTRADHIALGIAWQVAGWTTTWWLPLPVWLCLVLSGVCGWISGRHLGHPVAAWAARRWPR